MNIDNKTILCRSCKIELISNNISSNNLKKRNYICKKCNRAYFNNYYQKNKDELNIKGRKRRKEYYQKNKDNELLKAKVYREKNREKIKEYQKQYRQENKEYPFEWKEKNPNYRKEYYKNNKSYEREQHRLYYLKNKKCIKKYVSEHREEINCIKRRYYKTPKGRLCAKKYNYKHSNNYGYNPLNSWFEKCEGHHINNTDVIYIPYDVHISIPHRQSVPTSMIAINYMSMFFLLQQNIEELNKIMNTIY